MRLEATPERGTCRSCGQPVWYRQALRGAWAPFDVDGRRHSCLEHITPSDVYQLRTAVDEARAKRDRELAMHRR